MIVNNKYENSICLAPSFVLAIDSRRAREHDINVLIRAQSTTELFSSSASKDRPRASTVLSERSMRVIGDDYRAPPLNQFSEAEDARVNKSYRWSRIIARVALRIVAITD